MKLADYLITAVRYNKEHTHIDKVRAYPDLDTNLGSVQEQDRMLVVLNLKLGKTYRTLGNDTTKNANVGIVEVNNQEFLRTDANKTAADNLENLEEF